MTAFMANDKIILYGGELKRLKRFELNLKKVRTRLSKNDTERALNYVSGH